MANRRFISNGAFKTLTPDIVKLFGYVQTGSTGAVTAASTKCDGFSISRTAAGRYVVALDDKYERFLGIGITVNGASSTAYMTDKGLSFYTIGADAVNSGVSKSITVQFVRHLTSTTTSTYVNADLEDNAEVCIEITLKNSQIKGAQL